MQKLMCDAACEIPGKWEILEECVSIFVRTADILKQYMVIACIILAQKVV